MLGGRTGRGAHNLNKDVSDKDKIVVFVTFKIFTLMQPFLFRNNFPTSFSVQCLIFNLFCHGRLFFFISKRIIRNRTSNTINHTLPKCIIICISYLSNFTLYILHDRVSLDCFRLIGSMCSNHYSLLHIA